MPQTGRLKLLAIALSLLGLLALYLQARSITPPSLPLNQVSNQTDGAYVQVHGTLREYKTQNVTHITLCERGACVGLLATPANLERLHSARGSATITGIVNEYNGQRRLVAINIASNGTAGQGVG